MLGAKKQHAIDERLAAIGKLIVDEQLAANKQFLANGWQVVHEWFANNGCLAIDEQLIANEQLVANE